MGLSFPPARFVANVTSAASELLRAARQQLRAKKEEKEARLGLSIQFQSPNPSPGQQQQQQHSLPQGASVSSNVNNAAEAAAAASAAAPPVSPSPEGEVEAGLAKALVLHTPSDVFVVFRGTMSRRDFDHINLVVYPVEAGAFYGAQSGEKVFVVSCFGWEGAKERERNGRGKNSLSPSLDHPKKPKKKTR